MLAILLPGANHFLTSTGLAAASAVPALRPPSLHYGAASKRTPRPSEPSPADRRLRRTARHFRCVARWARRITRNICTHSQNTPVRQAAHKAPQRRVIFGSFVGTCGETSV